MLNKEYPNVNLIPFASKATNESYANKRAEMYFNLAKAVRNGLYIDDPMLTEELTNTRFMLDKNDKYILMPKAELKLILNRILFNTSWNKLVRASVPLIRQTLWR